MTRLYLNEVAEQLGVRENTIRGWVRKAKAAKDVYVRAGLPVDMPDHLLSESLWPEVEGGRQKLYWSPSQINGLKEFAELSQSRWCGHARTPAKDDYSAFADFMDREELATVPLEDFDFKVRVLRTLERAGIQSVFELARMSKADREKRMAGFGKKSIEEVWTKVMAYLERPEATT